MQLDDLRSLLALGDHRHVTEAAAALGTTQPSLSRLLARVEAELGVRLFERDAKGVHPNPLGDLTLAAARDLVGRYDRLRTDLAGLLDPDSGTVRLAFLDSMATSLVPRILHDVREQAPHLRIELRQEPGHVILPDLATGAAELALTSPEPDGPYGWLALQSQALVLVVPPGHRLAGRRRVRLTEVAGEDFVTIPPGFGFRAVVDDLFAAAGAAPRIALEIGDLATIEGLVGAGLGVALVPEQFAGATGTIGVGLAGPGVQRVVGLTWRTDRPLGPAAERFRSIVAAAGPYDSER
ncbi:LysR family transcriptional regulator [Actinoplanes couchii]|uniref:LysR family transcriptional regulator n=1 Tax=Actinoplanes couchii TaxID=403638 RepID=A0ABQ3XH89_9ACTN|nr:LysR family transcriptional regulator [Actinoplanes couchii]MDR6320656.1 DNA-binding transcriptional LysR family regulator [Actinoplanes couchii]GID57858.1 LysR family transcriptional regulator [Actinoplanes couchii]